VKSWQAVRELYEIVPARKWKNEENRMNKIVFIGNMMGIVLCKHRFEYSSYC